MDFFSNGTYGISSSSYYVDIGMWVHFCLTITFIIIGTIGNILSIIVVTNRRSKKSSFTVSILALAIVDTFALFVINIENLFEEIFQSPIIDIDEAVCKMLKYFEEFHPG